MIHADNLSRTFEEKMAALVEYIKKEFPDGCSVVDCDDCEFSRAGTDTVEFGVCELLSSIACHISES